MLDLVIKNGRIVSPDSTLDADLAIQGETIVAVGRADYFPHAIRTVDARGKYVLPGGIDTHTHFEDPPFMGQDAVRTFLTGSRAVAVGGTTTIIDFAIQGDYGTQLPLEVIEKRLCLAKEAAIDYSFHFVLTRSTPETITQLRDVIDFGIPSIKCITTYSRQGIMADDGLVLEALRQTKRHNGLFAAHAENDAMAEYNIRQALQAGQHEPIQHALTKNTLVEAESIHRLLFLAQAAGAAFYDFHLSCREGAEFIRRARGEGRPVYAETTTHYLTLTAEKLKGPDGINFICSPPLRAAEDVDALWQALSDGTVQVVASDDCAFTAEQKLAGGNSFEAVPNGLHGAEFRMPVVFSEGVTKGRLTVNQFAAVTSANPARIFGLFPRKGIIAPGSDADVVIIDPRIRRTIATEQPDRNGIGWTPYEGMEVRGWPVMTVSRGRIVAEDGKFSGSPGWGKFLKRKLDPYINCRPII